MCVAANPRASYNALHPRVKVNYPQGPLTVTLHYAKWNNYGYLANIVMCTFCVGIFTCIAPACQELFGKLSQPELPTRASKLLPAQAPFTCSYDSSLVLHLCKPTHFSLYKPSKLILNIFNFLKQNKYK